MNFNLHDESHDNEYNLFRSTTEEVISLYGVPVKYLITEKVNQDQVFGEHSHIKVDNETMFEFFALPSEADNWGGDANLFGRFGLQDMANISVFVSRTDMEKIHPEIVYREGTATVDNMPIGNLVVFNSNKIMEVSNFELTSAEHGNNNVFTSDRIKNVYKLTLKTYIANRDDFSKAQDITESDKYNYEDFGNLDSIFSDEEDQKDMITHKSQDIIIEDEVVYPSTKREKPVRNKQEENNPFGDFG